LKDVSIQEHRASASLLADWLLLFGKSFVWTNARIRFVPQQTGLNL
jgi:hypothetical protein